MDTFFVDSTKQNMNTTTLVDELTNTLTKLAGNLSPQTASILSITAMVLNAVLLLVQFVAYKRHNTKIAAMASSIQTVTAGFQKSLSV